LNICPACVELFGNHDHLYTLIEFEKEKGSHWSATELRFLKAVRELRLRILGPN
jgi:hypothetical protein